MISIFGITSIMEEHPQARYIVDTLAKAGFVAYYAGGWVRDLLLNHPSDDIDIATNAPPETIQALFPHTVPIGIAFGIVLVIIDSHQYEVATFRRDFGYKDARRPCKVEFTTAIEDAKRRDFTINGMFYDPIKEELLDFVKGREDLEKGIIRAIGDAHLRFQEDRLRMIRALRLACRFGFQIEPITAKAIKAHAKELFPAVAIERVVQEFTKAYKTAKLRLLLLALHEFSLLQVIFPELESASLEEISHRLEPTKNYPQEAPLIASLTALFPHFSIDELFEFCKKLKVSNQDLQFAMFLYRTKELLEAEKTRSREIELFEWTYFYANHFSKVALQVLSCHAEEERREPFFKEHDQRITLLSFFIRKIQEKSPLVTSHDLKELGIEPGKKMGSLLKEAEKLSINEQITKKEEILVRLQEHPLWTAPY